MGRVSQFTVVISAILMNYGFYFVLMVDGWVGFSWSGCLCRSGVVYGLQRLSMGLDSFVLVNKGMKLSRSRHFEYNNIFAFVEGRW